MRFKRNKLEKVVDSMTKAVVKEIDVVKNAQKIENEVIAENAAAQCTPSKKLSKKSQRIIDAALKIKALFGSRNNTKNPVDPRTEPLVPKGTEQENGVVAASGNERGSMDGSVDEEHVGQVAPFVLSDPFEPSGGPLNSNPVTPSDVQAIQRGHQQSGAVTNLEPQQVIKVDQTANRQDVEVTNGFASKDFTIAGQ